MTELILLPGPLLEHRQHAYNAETEAYATSAKNVTSQASEYLFHDIELHPEVVFSDILSLVGADPVMQIVFKAEFAQALLEEAAAGPVPQGEVPNLRIEFIELMQLWGQNTSTGEYSNVGNYFVRAESPPLTADLYDDEEILYEKGSRISWALSFKGVRELLNVPIRVSEALRVTEVDEDSLNFAKPVQLATVNSLSLGVLIRQLLKFVTPQNYALEVTRQAARVEELSPAVAVVVPFEETSVKDPGPVLIRELSRYLDGLERGTLKQVLTDIKKIPDDSRVTDELTSERGSKVTVKLEYAGLNGKAIRKLVREALSQPSMAPTRAIL